MPIESNKPPDLLFDEFCELTKMTLAEEICNASFNDTRVKVVKGKHCKPFRGIKISTTGSAGAGSILRRLRSAKVSGKACERVEGSPVDSRGGKRSSSTPVNNEITQVLSNLKAGNISHLKFDIGRSSDDTVPLNKVDDMNNFGSNSDGSFIKKPLENCGLNMQNSLVAKSCGLKASLDHFGMGDVGSTIFGLASSKDGIAIAEKGNLNGKGMAGLGTSSEHISMDDVVNTSVVHENSQDGIASNKVGRGFEFGKKVNSNGILKSPVGPFFSV
ncbi:hypothetical protein Tco_0119013, partial [Tanacetum coccineum]